MSSLRVEASGLPPRGCLRPRRLAAGVVRACPTRQRGGDRRIVFVDRPGGHKWTVAFGQEAIEIRGAEPGLGELGLPDEPSKEGQRRLDADDAVLVEGAAEALDGMGA